MGHIAFEIHFNLTNPSWTVKSDSSKEAKQILDDIIEVEEEESRQIEKLEQLKPEAGFQTDIFNSFSDWLTDSERKRQWKLGKACWSSKIRFFDSWITTAVHSTNPFTGGLQSSQCHWFIFGCSCKQWCQREFHVFEVRPNSPKIQGRDSRTYWSNAWSNAGPIGSRDPWKAGESVHMSNADASQLWMESQLSVAVSQKKSRKGSISQKSKASSWRNSVYVQLFKSKRYTLMFLCDTMGFFAYMIVMQVRNTRK